MTQFLVQAFTLQVGACFLRLDIALLHRITHTGEELCHGIRSSPEAILDLGKAVSDAKKLGRQPNCQEAYPQYRPWS